MTLFDVVKINLARYRMNSVMIVPPLVVMIFPIITSARAYFMVDIVNAKGVGVNFTPLTR